MNIDNFDFGFTTVDESELESNKTFCEKNEDLQNRLNLLYTSIIPLIDNLKKNPEKDYIFWPDRQTKVDAFLKKITAIYRGEN
jgi:hypothetical protein